MASQLQTAGRVALFERRGHGIIRGLVPLNRCDMSTRH